jgi:hypothetical protein
MYRHFSLYYVLTFFNLLEENTADFDQHQLNETSEEWKQPYIKATQ